MIAVRWPLAVGAAALVVLIAGFGAWATFAKISGAVIAAGRIEAEQTRQVVQHPTGGTVVDILVADGDRVTAGTPLIMLDPRRIQSEIASIDAQLAGLVTETARLIAERDGMARPNFDPEGIDPKIFQKMAAAQTAQLESRRSRDDRQIAQMNARLDQLAHATLALQSQLTSVDAQRTMLTEEIAGQVGLEARGLARSAQVLALRRDLAMLDGQHGQITANLAQAQAQGTEIRLQIGGVRAAAREEAISRLREIGQSEPQLRERLRSLQDSLADQTIRATANGIVHDLRVHARGSVVAAGATLMFIVPEDQPLHVIARVDPRDLDRLDAGLSATIRVASARREAPLFGTIQSISPDTLSDETSGRQFYSVRVTLDRGTIDAPLHLVPGLPVEVFFGTGTQSPFQILAYPLSRFFDRSLREG